MTALDLQYEDQQQPLDLQYESAQPQGSWLSALSNGLVGSAKPIAAGAIKDVGALAQAATGKALNPIGSAFTQRIMQSGFNPNNAQGLRQNAAFIGNNINNLGGYLSQDANQLVGLNNPNIAQQLISGGTQLGLTGLAGPGGLGESTLGMLGAGKLAPYLANALGRFGGGTAFSAASNPNAPVTQDVAGGALNSVLGALPDALASRAAAAPQNITDKIVNTLSQGRHSSSSSPLSDVRQDLASEIQNGYQGQKSAITQDYNNFFGQYGGKQIYGSSNPSGYYTKPSMGAFEDTAENLSDIPNSDLKNLTSEFQQNPTFENAHALQSEMGAQIGQYKNMSARGNLDAADNNRLNDVVNARNALQSDMHSFLDTQDPNASAQYAQLSENYKNNVVPYLSHPTLARIAKGAESSPSAGEISSIFANPQDAQAKVLSDLSPEAPNKIVYSALGNAAANGSPKQLMNALNGLDQKGMADYITPEVAAHMQKLNGSMSGNSILPLLGMIGGAALGHLGNFGEEPGMLGGAYLGYKTLQNLAHKSGGIPQGLANAGASVFNKTYPGLSNAAVGSLPGYNGGNQ